MSNGVRNVVAAAMFIVCWLTGFVVGRQTAPPTMAYLPAPQAAAPEAPAAPAPPEPVQSLLSQVVGELAGASCVDQGESQMGAPHFCRWTLNGELATVAIHWWGDMSAPTRVFIATMPGSGVYDNPEGSSMMMALYPIQLARGLGGEPDGLWAAMDAHSTLNERTYRTGPYTVTVRAHRLRPTAGAHMFDVDVTFGE